MLLQVWKFPFPWGAVPGPRACMQVLQVRPSAVVTCCRPQLCHHHVCGSTLPAGGSISLGDEADLAEYLDWSLLAEGGSLTSDKHEDMPGWHCLATAGPGAACQGYCQ